MIFIVCNSLQQTAYDWKVRYWRKIEIETKYGVFLDSFFFNSVQAEKKKWKFSFFDYMEWNNRGYSNFSESTKDPSFCITTSSIHLQGTSLTEISRRSRAEMILYEDTKVLLDNLRNSNDSIRNYAESQYQQILQNNLPEVWGGVNPVDWCSIVCGYFDEFDYWTAKLFIFQFDLAVQNMQQLLSDQ